MTDYSDPNLSLDELLVGARTHPWQVELNPSLDLLSLENPEKMDSFWFTMIVPRSPYPVAVRRA